MEENKNIPTQANAASSIRNQCFPVAVGAQLAISSCSVDQSTTDEAGASALGRRRNEPSSFAWWRRGRPEEGARARARVNSVKGARGANEVERARVE